MKNKPEGWRNEPTRHALSSRGIETTADGKRWDRFKKQTSMVGKDLGKGTLYEDDFDYFMKSEENEELKIHSSIRSKLKEMGLWKESYNTIVEHRDDVARDSNYDFAYKFAIRDTVKIGGQRVEHRKDRQPKIRGWVGINVDANNIVEDATFKISGLKGTEARNKLIDYIEEEGD